MPNTPSDILPVVRDILERTFFVANPADITLETVASDVDGWDSLTHTQVILAVERAFNVRFSAREVTALANVGDLVALIAAKTAP
ncbi:MAG: acyl carrier protein [Magnetococcales bacterium]|nr:acyl carrier protein [Magnetococcales bacterium]MBF0308030.1 acyl carrier protein [Magnetococcales bacterium]